jgi:hypothetical protein
VTSQCRVAKEHRSRGSLTGCLLVEDFSQLVLQKHHVGAKSYNLGFRRCIVLQKRKECMTYKIAQLCHVHVCVLRLVAMKSMAGQGWVEA